MEPIAASVTKIESIVGNDVDSKVVILAASVEMEPSINAEIELPARIQNPELQETADVNEQVTGTTETMMHSTMY